MAIIMKKGQLHIYGLIWQVFINVLVQKTVFAFKSEIQLN